MFLSKLKNKKEVISWSLFDFANQPFSTIIVTFIYEKNFLQNILLQINIMEHYYGPQGFL